MHFARSIAKAIETHSDYVIFIAFLVNSGYANARDCYVYTHISHFVYNNIHCYVFHQQSLAIQTLTWQGPPC